MKITTGKLIQISLLSALLWGAPSTSSLAQNPTLFEWGINSDTAIYTPADPLPGFVNFSAFDFTTGLGTITASISGVGQHYFSLYVDHEIDEAVNTWYNEYGEEVNEPNIPAKQSWEIDEPGWVFGDIYDNFLAGTLDNSNGVPQGSEDDVSMALAWDFTLGVGQKATINMTISDNQPSEAFYLAQTDPESDYTIYFSSRIRASSTDGQVPDGGGSFVFLAFTLAGLWGLRRTV